MRYEGKVGLIVGTVNTVKRGSMMDTCRVNVFKNEINTTGRIDRGHCEHGEKAVQVGHLHGWTATAGSHVASARRISRRRVDAQVGWFSSRR